MASLLCKIIAVVFFIAGAVFLLASLFPQLGIGGAGKIDLVLDCMVGAIAAVQISAIV